MRRSLPLALAAAALTLTALPGSPSVSAAATTAPAPGALRWGPCPEGASAPRLECSTLEVPLDYRDPHGRQIEVAVSRLASEKPSKRRGVLLTNPGGPGGSGLVYPAVLAASGLPQEVLDSYDIIGFDPRGVGRSTPVTCDLTKEQQWRGNFPKYAHTAADVTREAGYARQIAGQCENSKTAWMLPHTTTANTARDMDRLRSALGEPTLSYLGASYGSYLGAVYTTLFPRRGDRIVLDSNLGPDGYDVTAMRLFARGLEDRFPDFVAFAAAHPEYGLGSTSKQVTAKFYELVARLDAKPVQDVNGTGFRAFTFEQLYADGSMKGLAEFWQAVDTGRELPLPESPAGVENLMASRFAVVCADTRWPRTVREYQRNAAVDRVKYPMLGGSTASVNPCAYWSRERTEPPVRITGRGPSNVLMVQNERDPGTPLVGARELRRAFGGRVTMVTADQGGHGVYPYGGNTCANDAATTFLTTGERPARDLACAAEPGEAARSGEAARPGEAAGAGGAARPGEPSK
ncbi:alpha/beta hydrolase [Streptomyces sp. NPDC047070]|uniref:alpha/beta hydrolase n=1 Tax=Streptomyces sp. NPDC047070 TaxID=3154923 RepID=UPI003455E703